MLALIQRVTAAQVEIEGRIAGAIGKGLLVFLGIEKNDSREDADKLLRKVLAYRVFSDADEKMNLSVSDIGGGVLVVSQFTLAADTQRGCVQVFPAPNHLGRPVIYIIILWIRL